MIQETGLEHFFMQTRAVEACCHRQLHIVFQRFIGRCGINAVRIKSLIQNESLEHGFSVNQHLFPGNCDIAQSEIAVNSIFPKSNCQIIQSACSSLPQMHFGKRQRHNNISASSCGFRLATASSFIKRFCAERSVADSHRFDRNRACFHVRKEACFFHIIFRHELKPNRLPDTGGSGVFTAMGIVEPTLFAMGLFAASQIVLCVYGDIVCTGLYISRDIECKRGITAFMPSNLCSVDPYARIIIHRAKMQQNASFYLHFGQFYGLMIPYGIHVILIADSAQIAFRAKRNDDLFLPILLFIKTTVYAAFTKVERKIPFSV